MRSSFSKTAITSASAMLSFMAWLWIAGPQVTSRISPRFALLEGALRLAVFFLRVAPAVFTVRGECAGVIGCSFCCIDSVQQHMLCSSWFTPGASGAKSFSTLNRSTSAFQCLPFAMLVGEHPDECFPFWRSGKRWFLLAWMHFEQQRGAIEIVGVTGRSDDIGREGCLSDEICCEPSIRFQACDILRQVPKNKQSDIFLAVCTLLEAGRYLPR